MKNIRLLVAAFVVIAAGTWAVAHACDQSKQASASAQKACSAEMAKNCSAAQAATCPMKGAAAATAAGSCSAHGAQAANAAADCPYVNGKCVKTGMAGACPEGASAKAASATTKDACCASKGTSATAASATGSCSAHGTAAVTALGTAGVMAMPAGGPGCSSHSSAKAAGGTSCGASGASAAAHGCDGCAEWALCESQIEAAGAGTQVVALKNGIMYVYTADSPARVQQVQAALAQRNEHLAALASAGDKAKLCPECKAMRGATASGKLNREVVKIEGGCLALLTSNDPAVVERIHAWAGVAAPARAVKS